LLQFYWILATRPVFLPIQLSTPPHVHRSSIIVSFYRELLFFPSVTFVSMSRASVSVGYVRVVFATQQ